jgi:hypothetical protein
VTSADQPKKRRVSAKGSRNKGLAYERELIAHMQERLGIQLARGVAGAQAFDMSKGSNDIFGLPRLGVEAKRTETISVPAFRRQAKRNSTSDEMPVVIHRCNRQETGDSSVILSLDDFLTIYDAFLRLQGFK